jgi:hypothetical protein
MASGLVITSAATLKPNKVPAWPSEGMTPAAVKVACWALVKSLQNRTPLSPWVTAIAGGGAEPPTTMSSTLVSVVVLVKVKVLPVTAPEVQPDKAPE